MAEYDWYYKKQDERIFKILLKNFTGISFREKGTVNILEEHLGLKSEFVLDPTLIINQEYYLNEIKNYKSNFDNINEKFIFVYQLKKNLFIENTTKLASERFNLKINKLQLEKSDYIESFIYGISKCNAVITDSFHGTVFSIIFKKPFITFAFKGRGKARLDSLKEVFDLKDRIIEPSDYPNLNINLLMKSLNINQNKLNQLKLFSINYLKRNLDIKI